MDRQSEWIILRRMCAFLRSRNLNATARTLEQESGTKFDHPHVRGLLRRGRWRSADKYVSSFLAGDDDDVRTPAASAALSVIRFERFVRALRRGSRAWALRYFDRSIEPLRANHPGMDQIDASCARALSCRPGSLRPDDAQHRERCVARFSGLIGLKSNERQLHRCRRAFVHDRFMGSRVAGTLALRNPCLPMKRKPHA